MADPITLDSLHRFVTEVPSLWSLMQSPAATEQELSLRSEMRRTLRRLADTLRGAAERDGSAERAAYLRATATLAAQLAAGHVPVSRDH